jgi:hypothetical protein
VDAAGGGRDDGEAAFPAGLDEDFDLVWSAMPGRRASLVLPRAGPSTRYHMWKPPDGDWCEAAGHESVEDVFDAVVAAGFAEHRCP